MPPDPESAEGKVTSYEKVVRGTGSDERKDVRNYVIVQFTAEDDSQYHFTGPNRQEEGPFKIWKGDSVRVLYDPQNPENARVNSFLGMWFTSTILIAVGSAFIIVSLLTYWSAWKWVKKQKP